MPNRSKHPLSRVLTAVMVFAVILHARDRANGQPVHVILGVLPGHNASYATDVGDFGATVAGYSMVANASASVRAFRWTPGGGFQSLGLANGASNSHAYAMSADGSVVVGIGATATGDRSFRWTQVGGMETIGSIPNSTYARTLATTSDGSILVGYAGVAGGVHGFVWSAASEALDIGAPGPFNNYIASGVSADGRRIAGYSGGLATRWSDEEGFVALGYLPNGSFSMASGVSDDGAVIVGTAASIGFQELHAFRWTDADGMQDLGVLPNTFISQAVGTNADGSAIVGTSSHLTSSTPDAMLWTPQTGMVNLNTYLPTLGVDLHGMILREATAISRDGTAIVGNGQTGTFQRAWIVTGLPCLGNCPRVCDSIDFNRDTLLPDTDDIADFLTVLAGGPCGTAQCGDIDFNNDGLAPDVSDIAALLSVFSGGPCL